MFLFAPQLVSFFNKEVGVIDAGTRQARVESLFFFLLALSHCLAGIFRGAGKTKVPMFVMLAYWCIVRIIYITVATHFIHDIKVIFWAYPLTWTLSSVTFIIYYFRVNWMRDTRETSL